MTRARRLVTAFLREEGNATIEFTLLLPVVMFVFFAVFEAGMFMTRYVMLDRALDMAVRDLRLGILVNPTFEDLKKRVCDRTSIFPKCMAELKLELTPVDTATWIFPATSATCVDRSQPIKPNLELVKLGVANQAMLIRACTTMTALFPTTGIGLRLPKAPNDATGYQVFATSAYTNEP